VTTDPAELVTEFCARWAAPNVETILSYFTEDAIYYNIPMAPAEGVAAIRTLLPMMLNGMEGIDFVIHRQIAHGDLVMNERTDVMRRTNGARVELPVMGVFEVRDGRIAAWRDYFDLATVTAGLA